MDWWTTTDTIWWWNGSVTDRQWPCPDWYHVPTNVEYANAYNTWAPAVQHTTSVPRFLSDFLMPIFNTRNIDSTISSTNSSMNYWTSIPSSSSDKAYVFRYSSNYNIYTNESYNRAYWYPVRCFKNTVNQDLPIYPYGWTWVVITIDNWVITNLWAPSNGNYVFWWWYKDSNLTKQVGVWSGIADITALYAKWDERSITCSPWEYLPAWSDGCTRCTAWSYCVWWTFAYDEWSDQWITSCTTLWANYTSPISTPAATGCYMPVSATFRPNWNKLNGWTSEVTLWCNRYYGSSTCWITTPTITANGTNTPNVVWYTTSNAWVSSASILSNMTNKNK